MLDTRSHSDMLSQAHTEDWRGGDLRSAAARRAVLATLHLLALGTLLAVAACGQATSTGQRSGSASPTPSPTPALTCRADQLALTQRRSGVALGNVAVDLAFQNQSSQGCTLSGYPAVQLLDANRHPLTIHQQQVTSGFTFTNQQVQTVPLVSGASAYFRMEWVDVPTSDQACPGAASAEITPPGAATALPLSMNVNECGGTITTSPVEPSPV